MDRKRPPKDNENIDQEQVMIKCVEHETLRRTEYSLKCGDILSIKDIIDEHDRVLNQNSIYDHRDYNTKRKYWKAKTLQNIPQVEFQHKGSKKTPECIYLQVHKSKILEKAIESWNENQLERLWSAATLLRNDTLSFLNSTKGVEFHGSVKVSKKSNLCVVSNIIGAVKGIDKIPHLKRFLVEYN